jgi:Spy/CpxP family protein refolding chaperone
MNRKPLLALAALTLFSAPLAFAQMGGPGMGGPMQHREMGGGGGSHMGPGGMWWKNPHIVTLLALTPEQQKKMNDIFEESRLKLVDMHANVQKAEIPMEALLAANPPDTAKVLAQIDKLAEARKELEKADARMLLGIRGVLTPDQWTKLQAEHANHGGMKDDRDRGDRRGGPDGHKGPGGRGQGGPGQGPNGMTAPPPPPTA